MTAFTGITGREVLWVIGNSLPVVVVLHRRSDRLLCQHGAVELVGGQTIQRLGNRFVGEPQYLFQRLALDQFSSHRTGRDGGAAAKGLKLYVGDNTVLNFEVDFHNISADGVAVIIGNISNVPSGLAMIFKMAFSVKAVSGGLCGSIVASMMQALRFGVARGVFSNEAGMGSAAITAAAATTTDPVRQGYINMTGTFWDTIVVCTITGLCIASSGALGSTELAANGNYSWQEEQLVISSSKTDSKQTTVTNYSVKLIKDYMILVQKGKEEEALKLTQKGKKIDVALKSVPYDISGTWTDTSGNEYIFNKDSSYEYHHVIEGSALTIRAFETVLGGAGGALITISIALFAFSTILGWEYHGEKALEYLLGTHRFNMVYRIAFSLLAFVGATTTLEIAWTFSDIANALMAIPNLICMLALSSVIKNELERYQPILMEEKRRKKLTK